ncbi:hypothetical protein A4V12_26095 [Streptomyces noursei]|nr:hypothetical protein A4V12_26095 [Streptomyces noursei]
MLDMRAHQEWWGVRGPNDGDVVERAVVARARHVGDRPAAGDSGADAVVTGAVAPQQVAEEVPLAGREGVAQDEPVEVGTERAG